MSICFRENVQPGVHIYKFTIKPAQFRRRFFVAFFQGKRVSQKSTKYAPLHILTAAVYILRLRGHTGSVPVRQTAETPHPLPHRSKFFGNGEKQHGNETQELQHQVLCHPVQAQHGHRKLLRSGLHLCGHSRIQPHCTGMHQL